MAFYDAIGKTYAQTRRSDSRIAEKNSCEIGILPGQILHRHHTAICIIAAQSFQF
jgi:hypothetical protein